MRTRIVHGEVLSSLAALAGSCVDAIISNVAEGAPHSEDGYRIPPADFWAACYRVLKPGGFVAVLSGTRKQHRLACAIEDGGFEILDLMAWLHSGPGRSGAVLANTRGALLRPAFEPITIAWRKDDQRAPSVNGAAAAVRLEPVTNPLPRRYQLIDAELRQHVEHLLGVQASSPDSVWPANVVHDGSVEVARPFPLDSARARRAVGLPGLRVNDTVARYFYAAKLTPAELAERAGAGVDAATYQRLNQRERERLQWAARRGEAPVPAAPLALLRHLCRLLAPTNGTVLDPLMHTGCVLKAAEIEGFSAIGISPSADEVRIATERLRAGAPLFRVAGPTTDVKNPATRSADAGRDSA